MMASWWAVAEDVHYVATHPPASAIFWAQDQNGAEAFDVAISSKVPKVKVISSAAPGWLYNQDGRTSRAP
jgi:hypothetical protein